MSLVQNRFGAQLPHIATAQGVWLTDTAGRRYLDGCSGAVVASLGHGHPEVLAAIREQAGRATYVHAASSPTGRWSGSPTGSPSGPVTRAPGS